MAASRIESAADLGRLIRARRKQFGYTQAQIAMLTGYSPRLIGDMEHGKPTVGFERYLALAQGLGIDLSATIRGEL